MQEFFIGWHQPVNGRSGCANFDRCMISINRLLCRRSSFPVRRWMLDSGAFTRISSGKGHLPVKEYAEQIDRWAENGDLAAVVSQDWMCEPFIKNITGASTKTHQSWTIDRYDELMSLDPMPYIMPVVQGYEPCEYISHVLQYGNRLKKGMWVGVGSVCKRNASPGSIVQVLLAIKSVRPDLRLHGFGVKMTALRCPIVWDLLYSADSAAATLAKGSGSNKYVGSNDPITAEQYSKAIVAPVQLSIFAERDS